MTWIPKTRFGKALLTLAGIAGCVTTIVVCVKTLDIGRPAWSSELKDIENRVTANEERDRLDRLEQQIENNQFRQNFLIIMPAPVDPGRKALLEQQIQRLTTEYNTLIHKREQLAK